MSKGSRVALAAVLALSAAGLSAAQDTQPNIRMARELVAAASAFETYTRTAGAIAPRFAAPVDVARAVNVGASHDPSQLEAGMVAYAALAAVQEPEFVSGVRWIAADPTAREMMVRRLTESPEAAMELPGADVAAAHAQASLLRQIEPLIANGRLVKQAAYDMQRRKWSKTFVPDARGRLVKVKALSSRQFEPSSADAERLYQALIAPVASGGAAQPSPVVLRGLAVAALVLTGRAGEDHAEAVRPLLSEPRSASCVRLAKLNLFQCMAVAGPHYEDVFCLGEHAMIEPGQCMAEAAGAPQSKRPIEVARSGGELIPVTAPGAPDGRR